MSTAATPEGATVHDNPFNTLTRSVTTVSRRRFGAPAGLALVALLAPVGDGEGAAKNTRSRKKKRCPKKPFCAGKDCTADVRCERRGAPCFCRHRPDTGEPFCSKTAHITNDCAECAAGELCSSCFGTLACSLPCPDPL